MLIDRQQRIRSPLRERVCGTQQHDRREHKRDVSAFHDPPDVLLRSSGIRRRVRYGVKPASVYRAVTPSR